MRRGFTLIELSYVLVVMGILVAISVPSYDVFSRQARADEARSMLPAIAHAELRHFRDRGGYLACAAEGSVPRTPVNFPNESACWKALGIRLTGQVRFRYSVEVVDGHFFAIAEGDLDGDGVSSVFRWDGSLAAATVERELE
ncbi:MAG: prepilin-type N-terminal cleavage/methylation domain-containing protein [Archangium sp.]|nr:prepilin-type N-terminal cleavage/methylation domain-containing protein [Archangium sp.]